MEKNNKKKIIIIVSILVLVSVIGGTLAYFLARVTSEEQLITSKKIDIVYSNENTFNLTDIEPIKNEEIESSAAKINFDIINNDNNKVYLKIKLIDITMSDGFKNSDFRWALYQENNKINEGYFEGIDTNNNIELYSDIIQNAKESKNYTVYIWIKETPDDQSSMMNQSFKSKIEITGYMTPLIKKDNSGANAPILADGMIPVIYDEVSGNWKIADTKEEWYNYDNQMWANAVTTSTAGYRTAKAGTIIPMSSINSMWVWIPRYKYKIPSNIGGTAKVKNPPQIDVVFESGINTTGVDETTYRNGITDTGTNTNYYTHPAFRDGSSVYNEKEYDVGGWDRELTGIWVGKFETSTDNNTCNTSSSQANCQNVNPTIKPDVTSLMNQNVSTQFITSLKFAGGNLNSSTGKVTFSGSTTYGLTSTTNTHMMKNTEWGAVAILSQSKYGKMGNTSYSGTDKEIYSNNSIKGYTGRSGGSPSGSISILQTYPDQTIPDGEEESDYAFNTYGFYTFDDYLLNYNTNDKGNKVTGKGVGASTTGTIYGIYDMSGGTMENTMGSWNRYAGYNSSDTSGFNGPCTVADDVTNGISFPENKYIDDYSYTPGQTSKEKTILGEATWETNYWYYDSMTYPYNMNPFTMRGGNYDYNSSFGIFHSNYGRGGRLDRSFRTVLIY